MRTHGKICIRMQIWSCVHGFKTRIDTKLTSMPSCGMLTDPGHVYHSCFGSKIELVKLDDSRQIYFVALRLLFTAE